MIKITRLAKPRTLQEKETERTTELCIARQKYYQALRDFASGISTKKPIRPGAQHTRYAHDEVQERLKQMFGRKCAYCESSVTAVSYHHVEHFRPQSIYPRLAYTWENLLLACTVCNSGYKSDQFPLIDGSQPMENTNMPCLLDASDSNALIDPCIDDPGEFFDFEDEWIVCQNDRARYTRDVCGLNREDLRDQRREWLTLIEVVAKAFLLADKHGEIERRKEFAHRLRRCLSQSASYSAMTRAKLNALGINTSDLLPEDEDKRAEYPSLDTPS